MAQDIDNFLDCVAKIQWGMMIVIYCISHAPALILFPITNF
jgi:phosphatidate cytidylyltransferase